jgi:hypothetical protein
MTQSFLQTTRSFNSKTSAAFETTPTEFTPAMEAFVASNGCAPLERVPVQPSPKAEAGWCFRNVQTTAEAGGGARVHGWIIWVGFMTAEFHVVWEMPAGDLIDVTPKVDGEHSVAFAPDPAYAAGFDFMKRPVNRGIRTYVGRPRPERARDAIACFLPKEEKSKLRRAQLMNMTLEEWVASAAA